MPDYDSLFFNSKWKKMEYFFISVSKIKINELQESCVSFGMLIPVGSSINPFIPDQIQPDAVCENPPQTTGNGASWRRKGLGSGSALNDGSGSHQWRLLTSKRAAAEILRVG